VTLSLEDRVSRTTKAAWQDLDGETVLLVTAEEKLLGLNAVAGRIWQLADGSRSVEAIAREIELEFDSPGSDVCRDTLSFVDRLVGLGLMKADDR
jgi:hypothetical protein